MLHRAGWPGYLDALLPQRGAGAVDIGHADGEVAEGRADLVRLGLVPVVRQLDDCVFLLIAIADEGERELAARIVLPPQQAHAQEPGVEIDRLFQVEHPDHRVQETESDCIALPLLESRGLSCHGGSLAFAGGTSILPAMVGSRHRCRQD